MFLDVHNAAVVISSHGCSEQFDHLSNLHGPAAAAAAGFNIWKWLRVENIR